MTTKISLFNGKAIRKTIHNNEWWFVINDVISVLTDSSDPAQYFKRMKERDAELQQLTVEGGVQFVPPLSLSMETQGGTQKMYCWHTEGIFRLIQSIPSPKAEPFKRWLAKVGYERMQEIEDPELATKRTRALYKAKGYTDAWIEKRMRGIAVREELMEEWKNRGVKEGKEYSILTAEISKAAFGFTPSEYKEHKGLNRENLRDHMDDLELIFSMLGEASTTKIARNKDAQGFNENKNAARKGGKVAGDARKALEIESGEDIVTKRIFYSNLAHFFLMNNYYTKNGLPGCALLSGVGGTSKGIVSGDSKCVRKLEEMGRLDGESAEILDGFSNFL